MQQDMLNFVKAMADADRLRIIGLLSSGPHSLTRIAAGLGIHPSDAARHLEQLTLSGAVREADGGFELDGKRVESLARQQLSAPREAYVPAPDLDARARKILVAYLHPDGSLKQIPLQTGRLKVILHYLVAAFTPGVDYTEKEVNTVLRRFHVDVAGLRRDLIDAGLMARESDGSRYWRV
ncbi:MAG TPA: DUF2087 domain-containing protein [Anaerolineales bacterium]|jgi:hypothetical protein